VTSGITDGLEFVDSNVLLYLHDVTAGEKHRVAKDLVKHVTVHRKGATSIQVMQEFYTNATRKLDRPLPADRARSQIRALALWPTHNPNPADVLAATGLAETAQLSFWDAMILTSAAALGCTMLWSEDLNNGQAIGGVTVRNPFAAGGFQP
jgi:predicted nucleic acid-binding protein